MTTTLAILLLALTLALPVVCAVVLSSRISRERGE